MRRVPKCQGVALLVLAVLYSQAPCAHAAPQRSRRGRAANPLTSSTLLSEGEILIGQGEYARGAAKYEEALRFMELEPQEADVGVPAATLASNAYWMAFEADGDIVHLQAAVVVLEHWREVAGPDSTATRLPEITRRLSRLREVVDPLEAAYQALETRDYEAAATGYERSLDAAVGQLWTWSAIAQLTLRTANANVSAFEAAEAAEAAERTPQDLSRLERARDLLQLALDKRPSADTVLTRTLQKRLGEVRERLEAAEEAERAAEAERARQAWLADKRPPPPLPVVELPPRRNVGGPLLIATGSAALAAGVGLVVTGFVAGSARGTAVEDAQQRLDDPAHGDVHYENVGRVREYEQETIPAYRSAMFISGSALAAGGIAIGTVGFVLWARARAKRQPGGRRAQLGATVSRAQLQLSLTTRF